MNAKMLFNPITTILMVGFRKPKAQNLFFKLEDVYYRLGKFISMKLLDTVPELFQPMRIYSF